MLPAIKRPERGVNDSPPSSAKVMNEWSYTSICLHGVDRENFTSTLTYLLSPWSRVLLEKLTGFQLLKKFPVFNGNRRFITAFTSAIHLSLS